MNGTDTAGLPAWELFFALLFSPQRALQQSSKISWALAYGISAAAFVLLFLQTGLDLQRAGKIETAQIAVLAAWGLALGTAGVGLIGSIAWGGARLLGSDIGWSDSLRSFGLAFCPSLLYGLFGLACNLALHWNTALAFGVTGLLWALGPVSAMIRQFTKDKLLPALLLTTLCGALMLGGWALLGGVL